MYIELVWILEDGCISSFCVEKRDVKEAVAAYSIMRRVRCEHGPHDVRAVLEFMEHEDCPE